eukprot:NODE_643_length_5058_cov_0.251664.p3 type:complete len:319 gc:universal NODE_643_length_5058_cov_0.251664:3722-4678(+)
MQSKFQILINSIMIIKDNKVHFSKYLRNYIIKYKFLIILPILLILILILSFHTTHSTSSNLTRNAIDLNFTFNPPKLVFMAVKDHKIPKYMKKATSSIPSDYQLTKITNQVCFNLISTKYPIYQEMIHALSGIMISDFCRYLFVYEHGGTYIDSDVSFKYPPDQWIKQNPNRLINHQSIKMIVGLETKYPGYDQPQFMNKYQTVQWSFSAYPNHPVLFHAIHEIYSNYTTNPSLFNSSSANVIELTGPGVMTRAVQQYLIENGGAISDLQEAPILVGDLFIGDPLMLNCYGYCDYMDCNSECLQLEMVHHYFEGSWKH